MGVLLFLSLLDCNMFDQSINKSGGGGCHIPVSKSACFQGKKKAIQYTKTNGFGLLIPFHDFMKFP